MDECQERSILFDLFESSGIGLIALDDDTRIRQLNANAGRYLDVEPETLVGSEVQALRPRICSAEFWRSFPGTFYCLAPGPHNLLLTVCRTFPAGAPNGLRWAVILRPYSLEREFGRMRVCLNNYLAHEIASHLNSVGIASEFITEPELRENADTRTAFLASFRHDLTDLNQLFVQLLETAEPLVLPNRIARAPVDTRALLEDLAAKIRGLASERSITLSCSLPPHLPSPSGDYHWLYLGFFGVLSHLIQTAVPLSEITVATGYTAGGLQTTIATRSGDGDPVVAWPPPALFPLDEAHPRIGRMEISDLTVARCIFLLHGGEVLREATGELVTYSLRLPA